MNKKSIATALVCYVVWGILAAYWNLLSGIDSMFILCCRIVFSLVLMLLLLIFTKRMHVLKATLRDKSTMKYLIPAGIIITFNWGLYIWAVNAGHVIDSSLGYYMNPLMVFALGVLMFKEKCSKVQLAAVGLAVIGVLVSVIAYGSFPYISIGLAVSFGLYGMMKKKAHADPVASICAETLIVTPFAIAFALIFKSDSIPGLRLVDVLLLIGAGAVTAGPLVLYSKCVNDIPFIVIGFFQYVAPTIGLIYGLTIGETLSPSLVVSFVFIWLGLVVFSVAMVKDAKKAKAAAQQKNV